jgi:hypothetical protein
LQLLRLKIKVFASQNLKLKSKKVFIENSFSKQFEALGGNFFICVHCTFENEEKMDGFMKNKNNLKIKFKNVDKLA